MWLVLIGIAMAGATGAVHVGHVDGTGIRWETVLDGLGTVTLPDGSEVYVDGPSRIETRQEDRKNLRPPIVKNTWQRIDLVGMDWTPDPMLGLERRVDAWAPSSFNLVHRAQLEALDPHLGFSVYVDGRQYPLGGEISPRGGVAPSVSYVSGVMFTGIIGAILLARRTLSRRVHREEADAYMQEEFLNRR